MKTLKDGGLVRSFALAAALTAVWLCGCGDKQAEKEDRGKQGEPQMRRRPPGRIEAAEISSAAYLLARQHALWEAAGRSLRGEKPNLNLLRSIDMYLGGRTHRRLAKEYKGSDKEQVLDKLESLRKAYQANVLPQLELTSPSVRLKPGATLEKVRSAFEKVDAEYKSFRAMVPGE